ncbi:MAG TPA: KTSC domain-containing protein [Allosphingosinicella sp.]
MALHVAELDSSAIRRAAYEDEARTLDIWYADGDRYSYFDVPMDVYRSLRSASSAGEYVNREIKPNYRYEIEARRRRFRPE